jgi:hypothetical protein
LEYPLSGPDVAEEAVDIVAQAPRLPAKFIR